MKKLLIMHEKVIMIFLVVLKFWILPVKLTQIPLMLTLKLKKFKGEKYVILGFIKWNL